MDFIAHKKISEDGKEIQQSVSCHCRRTAQYASDCLLPCKLQNAAYLAGLLHDAGKCKTEFQKYIYSDNAKRGSVNHTFAGCRMILEHFHGVKSLRFEDVTAELLAYAAGAHHGLFDCIDESKKSGFWYRQKMEGIYYDESKNNFLNTCADWKEIEALFLKADKELQKIYQKIIGLSSNDISEIQFYVGETARLLLSAVIEGDRRDTAEFMYGLNDNYAVPDCCNFWKKYLDNIEHKLKKFSGESDINKARTEISQRCRDFAENPSGIYRLNVPTGSGKTLSSLRYAVAHAQKYKKNRIIFVTPLLSILEQNAKVLRSYIGDDSIILEHHSNIINADDSADVLDNHELAVDSWQVPVIITTLVQLLNTMFSGKTTSVRRFQALCNSVVVIDEVQTVPENMLSLFNLTLNYLSEICGTDFLLCSSTQPCFEKAKHPLKLTGQSDVIPFDKKLWEPFKRTDITDSGAMSLEEIPCFAEKILNETDSLLVICNKKKEAEFLYKKLSENHKNCFHLSSSMCIEHRRNTLREITDRLKNKTEKIICVSTQVIEAGVDISFGCVIRLTAGMDSIVQAAGRCNRNGESFSAVPVYVVQCRNENLSRLKYIRRGKDVTIALLDKYRENPEMFKNDLTSDEAINWYYSKLYHDMNSEDELMQDYNIKEKRNTIFSMLSCNTKYYNEDCDAYTKYSVNQAFKTAGRLFNVFDNDTDSVVVPYGEGKQLIAELESHQGPCSIEYLKDWADKAKPYTVSLYEYQKEQLSDAITNINEINILNPVYYDEKLGISSEIKSVFMEV